MVLCFLKAGLGLELWSMQNDILFDNFILTDKKSMVDKWAEDSWRLKNVQELTSSTIQVSLQCWRQSCTVFNNRFNIYG